MDTNTTPSGEDGCEVFCPLLAKNTKSLPFFHIIKICYQQTVSSVETESIQSDQMCLNIYSDRNDFSFNVLLPTRHIQTWKYFTETNLIQTVIWLQCEYYRMSSSEHYVRVSIVGLYYCLYQVTTNCSLLQRCVCFMSLCVPSGSGPCTLQLPDSPLKHRASPSGPRPPEYKCKVFKS